MRVSRKMGPGKAWHTSDKSVRVTYGMNSTNEVKCYKVSSSGSLIASGFYGAGKLEVIVETDEDGHRSKTYTDSNERTLLTVSVNGEDSLATYYCTMTAIVSVMYCLQKPAITWRRPTRRISPCCIA